ncbi:sigma-70 family RNA polymerase sigma factor [Brevibacillus borstelensis]|uniref:RNA polymerase sigma factor n=1 Tax=Brevibacillus borstelensis TaxID=45462 RepID=UPI002E1C1981|nr:sigma-70 family RNA polymerase sigma factor [Brevibacillus borstelensis]
MQAHASVLGRKDTHAFEELMETQLTKVYRLCCWLVKDSTAAEDITQEVFIQAYKHLDSFRGESQIETWIYRIAVNESKRYLRSWSFRKLFYFSQPKSIEHTDVESEVMNKVEADRLERLVYALPFRHRQLIVLYYYQELSAEAIAQILGMKVGAVYTGLHRAREKLKKRLIAEEGGEWTFIKG